MIVVCATEAAWHRERALSIGASEAAAALGLSPWESLDEWVSSKSGLAARSFSSRAAERMRWGQYLEPVLGAHYGLTHGVVPQPGGRTIVRRDDTPWLHATPDFLVEANGVRWLVETKNGTSGVWGESHQPRVPLYYRVQVQQQLYCLDLPRGVLVCLVDGWDYREEWIERDEEFLRLALPKLEAAWGKVEAARRQMREVARGG